MGRNRIAKGVNMGARIRATLLQSRRYGAKKMEIGVIAQLAERVGNWRGINH